MLLTITNNKEHATPLLTFTEAAKARDALSGFGNLDKELIMINDHSGIFSIKSQEEYAAILGYYVSHQDVLKNDHV